MSSMFSRATLAAKTRRRESESLMSQKTYNASAGKSGGSSRETSSDSGRKRRLRGTGSCWK